MPKPKVLIIDDEPGSIEAFRIILKDHYDVYCSTKPEEGLKIIQKEDIQLVLLDVVMPDIDGITVLRQIRQMDNALTVIMITATKSIKTAVEAMKLGAFDYVAKPFEIDEAKLVVQKALQSRVLMQELEYLRAELKERYGVGQIMGKSKAVKEIFTTLKKVAPTKSTVLVTGESGTGKELVARAIHFTGPRKDRPFVVVQCAAIPETLLESELFGHEKGAFTDATSKQMGKFELADGGTLFLDEISEMSAAIQAKILRAIEQEEITRVGGTKPVKVDVRLVAATNRDLKQAVKEGTFREDLYYRINVVPFGLAPLRERKEDIPLLANYFLEKNKRINPQVKELAAETIEMLGNYHWPGNIRELENVIERVLTLANRPVIMPEDLPADIRGKTPAFAARPAGQLALPQAVEQLERGMIERTLQETNGVLTKTAERLGISRRILTYKMKSLGLKTKTTLEAE